MAQVLQKRGPGGYWLIGNEPELGDQDSIMVPDWAAGMYREMVDFIKGGCDPALGANDLEAKFIVGGWLLGENATAVDNKFKTWAKKLKDNWSYYKSGGNFCNDIAGWHFHKYARKDEYQTGNLENWEALINQFASSVLTLCPTPKEIWITEYGTLDAGDEDLPALIPAMRIMTNFLEANNKITRYAWFYALDKAAIYEKGLPGLFSKSGTIMPLGMAYMGLGSEPCSQATLSFSLKSQAINSQKPDKNVRVILKQGGTEKYRFDNVVVSSNSSGVYSGQVSGIIPGTYDVFVKGWIHLQKRFAGINLVAGNNNLDWSSTSLKIGDFNNDNILNINDVSSILAKYTSLSVPVTADNSLFDVDLGNDINISDVAFVLTNYTSLEVSGDQ